MNVILSRKGFDSSIQGGGNSSIIFENKFYSIPIPEAGTGIKYDDIKFDDNYSLMKVMIDLKIRQFTECHLDPYLNQELINKKLNWKMALGQAGGAQAHLKQNVSNLNEILFLFFGWFKKVELKKGKFSFEKNTPNIHCIWGYLNVEKHYDINCDELPKWVESHPHFKFKDIYGPKNSLYQASDYLTNNIPGAGTFNFSKELVLTREGYSRSNWKLPLIFNEEDIRITHLPPKYKWKIDNSNKEINLEAPGRGQEFIIIEKESKSVEKWALKLIKNNI